MNGEGEQEMIIIDSIPRTRCVSTTWMACIPLSDKRRILSFSREREIIKRGDDTQDLVIQLKLQSSRTRYYMIDRSAVYQKININV